MLLDRTVPKKLIWDIQPECIFESTKMPEYQNIRYLSPFYDSNLWARKYINSEDNKISIKMISEMFRYNSKLVQYVMPLIDDKRSSGGYLALPNSGYIYPTMKHTTSVYKQDGKLDKYKLKEYERTLRRCRNLNVDLTIFVSPSYSIKEKIYLQAIDKLAEVADSYEYELIDFSSDSRFMCDSTLFKDVAHLNDNGAQLYSTIITDVL